VILTIMTTADMPAAAPTDLPPPFQRGVFELDAEGICLLGSRCSQCGRHFFPRAALCLDCLATDPAPVRLSRNGVLECVTRVHMPARGFTPPYEVGYVTLPEGLRVFAPIRSGGRALDVGTAMVLVPFRLGAGNEEAMAYAFAPVDA
jgi:uncharacterized OB-fold protein